MKRDELRDQRSQIPFRIESEMSQHSWYKMFSKREYADAFLDGNVRFSTLAVFRDWEQVAIGDKHEGTQTWMPRDGVIVRGRKTGAVGKFTGPFGFHAITNSPGEIFVFCASSHLTNDLIAKFDARAYVEIKNKREFFRRIKKALPARAKLIAGRVEYYNQDDIEKTLSALMSASPEKIVLSKPDSFAYQKEYRFAFSVTKALDIESVSYCLREFTQAPDQGQHDRQTLVLGSLRDICNIRLIGVAESRWDRNKMRPFPVADKKQTL